MRDSNFTIYSFSGNQLPISGRSVIQSSDLDFCQLEVIVIHSLQTFATLKDKFVNLKQINTFFQNTGYSNEIEDPNFVVQLEFTNSMLDCELKIVDSIEDDGDSFQFTVYNIPDKTIFSVGDYLLFKYYWRGDPKKYTFYHGYINDIKSTRSAADFKTVIKGEVVHQNILYNWSIFNKYPKLDLFEQIPDFIQNELKLGFYSTTSGWEQSILLPNAIFTRGKSVGQILDEICQQVTENNKILDPANKDSLKNRLRWRLVNGETILFFRDSDLDGQELNTQFNIEVPAVNYSDLLEYQDNTENYQIQVFGIPTLKAGMVFYVDTTGTPDWVTEESAYFVAEEVEHNITCSDGYIMKIYARKIVKA